MTMKLVLCFLVVSAVCWVEKKESRGAVLAKYIQESIHYMAGFESAPDTVYDHPTMGRILLDNTFVERLNDFYLVPASTVTLRRPGKQAIASFSLVYPNASFIFQDYSVNGEWGIVFAPFNATVKLHYRFSGKHLCTLNLTKVEIEEFKTFDLHFVPRVPGEHSYDSKIVTKEFSSWMKNTMEQVFFERLEMATDYAIPYFNEHCLNHMEEDTI